MQALTWLAAAFVVAVRAQPHRVPPPEFTDGTGPAELQQDNLHPGATSASAEFHSPAGMVGDRLTVGPQTLTLVV
jgi:hypothetical protein